MLLLQKKKQETIIYIFEKTKPKSNDPNAIDQSNNNNVQEHAFKTAALAVALDNLLHDKKMDINAKILRVQVDKDYRGIACMDGRIIATKAMDFSSERECKDEETPIPLTQFKTLDDSIDELLTLKNQYSFPDIPIPKRYEKKFIDRPEFYLGKLLEYCWDFDRLDIQKTLETPTSRPMQREDGISNLIKSERRNFIKTWIDILLDSQKEIYDRIGFFQQRVQEDLKNIYFKDREPCFKFFFFKSVNDIFWGKINVVIREYQENVPSMRHQFS